jgi:hypothetical protein
VILKPEKVIKVFNASQTNTKIINKKKKKKKEKEKGLTP